MNSGDSEKQNERSKEKVYSEEDQDKRYRKYFIAKDQKEQGKLGKSKTQVLCEKNKQTGDPDLITIINQNLEEMRKLSEQAMERIKQTKRYKKDILNVLRNEDDKE